MTKDLNNCVPVLMLLVSMDYYLSQEHLAASFYITDITIQLGFCGNTYTLLIIERKFKASLQLFGIENDGARSSLPRLII
jgi:hypothetical protein